MEPEKLKEELDKLRKDFNDLKACYDAHIKADKEELVREAKAVSDLPETALQVMDREDLKKIIASKKVETPPVPAPKKDEKPYNPFAKPEGWL